MESFPIKTDTLESGFKLLPTIEKYLKKNKKRPKNGDILVISSKIIALSEGRLVDLRNVKVSARAAAMKRSRYGIEKEDPRITELVLQEADYVLPGSMLFTLKDTIFIASAGIDASNTPKGFVVLWPKNAQKTAQDLCKKFKKTFRLKNFGVVIADSHCTPLRWGVTGIALAWAGFLGIEDVRGQLDIYGKRLNVTRKAIADNLASTALILTGEGNEKIPMVLVRDAPVKFTNRIQSKDEMFIHPKECIFSGIYSENFLRMLK